MDTIKLEIFALDATFGYTLKGIGVVNGERTEINEHYATEAAMKSRLATLWQWWANQVDAE